MVLLVGFVALLSGMAALLFETLWFRLAGLTFGNSVWASSIVLSGFMCGLGLGNFWALGKGPRFSSPARVYAGLELIVGVTGFALVLFFPSLTSVLALLFRHTGIWALNPLRLACAFLLLVIPTAAMGATLPLLVTTLTRSGQRFAAALSWLYAANTLGAVGGALLGEVVLIPALGLRRTALLAAGLNLTAAALAWTAPLPNTAPDPGRESGGRASTTFLAAALSGGILLALEVVWFRFLLLFVQGFSFTFGAMLAVVLLGISMGGLAANAWLKRDPGAHAFASSVACLAGIVTVLSYGRFEAPLAFLGITSLEWRLGPIGALSFWLMFGTSFFSGVIFCFLGSSLKERLGDATRTTGTLTLANTCGASLGALGGGFLLLPHLGIELSLAALSLCYAGLAALLFPQMLPRLGHMKLVALTPAVSLVLVLVMFPFGFMRNVIVPRTVAQWNPGGRAKVVAAREDLTETVLYLARPELGGPNYRLVTNGFSMSDTGFMARRFMQLYAYWPFTVAGNAKDALVVSYGLGSTASALTSLPSLESLDVADISKDVLELGQHFYPSPGGPPLLDPRVHAHVEDGRFFLLTTDKTFDIVTSDPPPPRFAGVVNLYTEEYFSLVRSRLKPGGVVTHWLPIYQLAPLAAKGVVKGFCNAFPDCSLWTGEGLELVLVGTRDLPGPTSLATFVRPWQDPALKKALWFIGLETPESLGSLFLADSDTLEAWTKSSPPLRDDTPGILTEFPYEGTIPDLSAYADLTNPDRARERFRTSRFIARHWPPELLEGTLLAYDDLRTFDEYIDESAASPGILLPMLFKTLRESRSQTLAILEARGDPRWIDAVEVARAGGLSNPVLSYWHGVDLLSERRYAEAEATFAQLEERTPAGTLAELRALALCLSGEAQRARSELASHGEDASTPFWSGALPTCGDERRLGAQCTSPHGAAGCAPSSAPMILRPS
jgi:predicted membrane-bound spermidine synthase